MCSRSDFVDIADENSTVLFPVNKNILLVIYPEKQEDNSDYPRIIVANENLENQVNAFTVLNAERFVISYNDILDIERYKEFATLKK